jgi:acyl-CoA reductase-like NAD-dependent aldehyde dehydrogenase
MSETSIPALLSHLPSGHTLVSVINPVNGKKIYDLPQLSADDVVAAIEHTRAAAQAG